LYSRSVTVRQILIVISSAGTTWKIKLQDMALTPAILVPPWTVIVPSDGKPFYQSFDNPIPMEGGIDFITVSGTPGVADIWMTADQPST
jgi:hypothetical protein